MPEDRLLYLTYKDVAAAAVTMREIIDALEQAFRQKADGQVEMPPKPGVHPKPDAFIHLGYFKEIPPVYADLASL